MKEEIDKDQISFGGACSSHNVLIVNNDCQKLTPVSIEFDLNVPITKTRSKQVVFTLFNDLDINDEFDLCSINYIGLDQLQFSEINATQSSKLIHKISVEFKHQQVADKFFDYINSAEILNRNLFSNIIKNSLDFSDFVTFDNSVNSLSESIYIFPDDSDIYHSTSYANNKSGDHKNIISNDVIVNRVEDSFNTNILELDVSLVDVKQLDLISDLTIDTTSKPPYDTLASASSSSSACSSSSAATNCSSTEDELIVGKSMLENDDDDNKNEDDCQNRTVDFYSLEPIDESDLEGILLLLENMKRSGGCEIATKSLMQNNHLLRIEYKKTLAKKRVINKRIHQYKRYKLIANDPTVRPNEFEPDTKTIILRNIPSNTEIELIRLYCEYLVINDDEFNDVDTISSSKFFKNTFYIKFKLDIDLAKLKERLDSRLFCNRRLELMLAYNTNVFMMLINSDTNNNPIEDLENPIALIECISEECKAMVKSHFNTDTDKVEYLHNYDLLSEKLISKNKLKQRSDANLSQLFSKIEFQTNTNYVCQLLDIDRAKLANMAKKFASKHEKFFVLLFMFFVMYVNVQIFQVILASFKGQHVDFKASAKGAQQSPSQNPTPNDIKKYTFLISPKTCSPDDVSSLLKSEPLEKNNTIDYHYAEQVEEELPNAKIANEIINKTNVNTDPYLMHNFDYLNGGHTNIVSNLISLSNSNLLASGSFDKSIKIWDAEAMSLRFTFDKSNGGHNGYIYALESLGNGYLASGSSDSTIKIWDVNRGHLKYTFDYKNGGHTNAVSTLVSLDNGYFASGSWDSKIKVWDAKRGHLKFTFSNSDANRMTHTRPVSHLVYLKTKNGYLLASGSDDKSIKIWDLNSKSLKYSFDTKNNAAPGHLKAISSLVPLDNGYLASGSYDKSIKIWNANNGKLVHTFDLRNDGHSETVRHLIPLGDGLLVSGSDDKHIKIWDVNNGIMVRTLSGHNGCISSLAKVNGELLASGSDDNEIKIWNLNNGDLTYTFNVNNGGHNWTVNTLVSFGSNQLVSSSWDSTIKIWKL